MKILFTGGGTGGHFYPIIAVIQALNDVLVERKVLTPELFFMSTEEYDSNLLFENDVKFIKITSGKWRRYFSLMNFIDLFKIAGGCIQATISMYKIYPDVVFGKGGYTSFPALFAARILRIPVIIHESDAHPGKVNRWASKFARKIAVSYPGASEHFSEKIRQKIAYTGNPIRPEIASPMSNGANEFLKLEEGTPVVLVLGGSQGSTTVNNAVIDSLPELLNRYQVIHQTGKNNYTEMTNTTGIVLKDHPYAHRYHPYDYLNVLAMRMAAGVASVVVSRAGSTIFEIAAWGIPSILIPLSPEISHDQTANAYSYGKTGAASVIEETNLHGHILITEIDRICGSNSIRETMSSRAKAFSRTDSAKIIASALLDIALEHEK